MTTLDEQNRLIIKEFRENAGSVTGRFEGRPLLLLTTKGAKSGKTRVNPMMYLPDGDRWLVFASKAGSPRNPDWLHNLIADPNVSIEVGAEEILVYASVLKGEERDDFYNTQSTLYPQFAEYQKNTERVIPVVALVRR